MVSFDRWQSFDIQNELQAVGIKTETVSVAKKHYEDLAMMIYEERVAIPMIPILLEEMSELKIMKGNRVDHPRKNLKTWQTQSVEQYLEQYLILQRILILRLIYIRGLVLHDLQRSNGLW